MRYINFEKVIRDTFNNSKNISQAISILELMIMCSRKNIYDIRYLNDGHIHICMPTSLSLHFHEDYNQFVLTYRHYHRQHGVSSYSCDNIIPLDMPCSHEPTGIYIHKNDVVDVYDYEKIIKSYLGYINNIDYDYITNDMNISGFKRRYTIAAKLSNICGLNEHDIAQHIKKNTTIGELVEKLKETID